MKNSIKAAFVVAIAAVAVAACSPSSEQAAPTTASSTPSSSAPSSSTPSSQTATPAPPVVTEVVTEPVADQPVVDQPVAQAVAKTDNRVGYGALKLGMTLEEARAAGATNLTWESEGDGTCVGDAKVAISKLHGVVRITLPAGAKTSKGIGVGSTFGEVKRLYPGASEYRDGWSASLDRNSHYAFIGSPTGEHFADADKVFKIKLASNNADCSMYML